jgi:hypothetical protein
MLFVDSMSIEIDDALDKIKPQSWTPATTVVLAT